MARTALTKNTGIVTNPSAGVLLVWTAADITNFNSFAMSGKDIVLAWNTGASPYTITITRRARSGLWPLQGHHDRIHRGGRHPLLRRAATRRLAAIRRRVLSPSKQCGREICDRFAPIAVITA